jgi:hypothetical protein
MAGARHGRCELMRGGMLGEQHGHGMGTAWARHGMCELTFILLLWQNVLFPYYAYV